MEAQRAMSGDAVHKGRLLREAEADLTWKNLRRAELAGELVAMGFAAEAVDKLAEFITADIDLQFSKINHQTACKEYSASLGLKEL